MSESIGSNYSGTIGDGQAQVFGPSIAAQEGRRQTDIKSQQLFGEIQEKKRQRYEAKQFDFDLEGFEKDVSGELLGEKEKIRAATREIFIEQGVNDETLTQVAEMKSALRKKIEMSKGQKAVFQAAYKKTQNQTADKYFDIEGSLQNQKEFQSLSIDERADFHKPLLIRKEEQYSIVDDMPSYFWQSNFRANPKQFKDNIIQSVAKTPEGQEWFREGKEIGEWDNIDQAVNMVRGWHSSKYKSRLGRQPARKPWGELSDPNEANERLFVDSEGVPVVSSMTLGNYDFQMSANIDFISKDPESYGVTEFINNKGERITSTIPTFYGSQYFQNLDTGESYLMGRRKYIDRKLPEEFSEDGVKLAMADYIEEGLVDRDWSMDKKMAKTREIMARESEKSKTETIYIPLTTDELKKQQANKRKNIWNAHLSGINHKNFSDGALDFDEWQSNYAKQREAETAPKTKQNGVDIDNSIMQNLIPNTTN